MTCLPRTLRVLAGAVGEGGRTGDPCGDRRSGGVSRSRAPPYVSWVRCRPCGPGRRTTIAWTRVTGVAKVGTTPSVSHGPSSGPFKFLDGGWMGSVSSVPGRSGVVYRVFPWAESAPTTTGRKDLPSRSRLDSANDFQTALFWTLTSPLSTTLALGRSDP